MGKIVERKWEDKFVVREVWFNPGQNGFFNYEPAYVQVLGFRQCKNKTDMAIPLKIPLSIVEVKDCTLRRKPTLVIHRQTVSEFRTGSSSGAYRWDEMARAVFTLPPEMKLLVPQNK